MKRIILSLLALVALATAWAQKSVVWESPCSDFSMLTGRMSFSKVEFAPDKTTLWIRLDKMCGKKIGFASETRLVAGGHEYRAKSITGMNFNEPFTLPRLGSYDFSISFEAMPEGVESFDLMLDPKFSIRNIHNRADGSSSLDNTYWRCDRTGEWMVGFADRHIVYDGQCWDIVSKSEKGGSITYVARNEDLEIDIKVGKMKNGTRSIAIGKMKPEVCSIIHSKALPSYPSKDARADFADNHYRQGDSVTICGWLKGMKEAEWSEGREIAVVASSALTSRQKTYSAALDSLGRFTLRLPVENTTGIIFDGRRSRVFMLVEPGENYYILNDFGSEQTLVMGKNSRVQNEVLAHTVSFNVPYYEQECKGMDVMDFYSLCDSIKGEAFAQLDHLCMQSPTLSERFKKYWRSMIVSDFGRELMQMKYHVAKLPEEFLTRVENNYLKKIEKPYSITAQYFSIFFCYYYEHLSRLAEQSQSVLVERIIRDAEKDGVVKLSAEESKAVSDYVVEFNALETKLKQLPDSLKQKPIDEFNASRVVAIINKLYENESLVDYSNKKHELYYQEAGISEMMKRQGMGQLLDIYLCHSLVARIDAKREPLKEGFLEQADSYFTSQEIKARLHQENDLYKAIAQSEVKGNSLRSSNDVTGLSEGEKIMNKILEPLRGKVVVLDVWGTWCAPCKAALQHAPEEYEKFKDYDVVFLYLANRSPEEAWKNIIKEYGLTGDNIVHYNLPREQQSAVENFLSTRKFPSYYMFDKEGRLVHPDFEGRDLELVEKLLKQLGAK